MVKELRLNSRMSLGIDFVEKKLNFFARNIILSLFVICSIAIFLRLYYFPYGITISLDALGYFWYAIDTSILGHLPTNFRFPNTGWPIFLSIFFSIFHSNNFLDYMTLQRLVTVSISVLTIIPVYLLCNRFFNKSYSLIGASLFAFEPRIIQNSFLGLTEPFYIILTTTALFLFLSTNKKIVYSSFGITAFCAIIRYEGMLLFFVISIMFFVRYKKERKVILKYLIAACIFVLILLPVAYIRIQTTGSDGLTSNIAGGVSSRLGVTSNDDRVLFLHVIRGLENLFRYLGWVMIPFFVFFVPSGAILIFKNRNYSNITIILSIITLSIPAFYAYSREIQETRYLYVLYPLFCALSIFTVKIFSDRFRYRNIILILIMIGVLFSSLVFLDLKNIDYEHEKEAFNIDRYVSNMTKVINVYQPESKYLQMTNIVNLQHFPVLSTSIPPGVKILPIDGFNSLKDYIKFGRIYGLTHLVVDEAASRPSFLKDAFYNEDKYPYLTKIFDSLDYGYKYHVKIYKIEYDKFDSITHDNLK